MVVVLGRGGAVEGGGSHDDGFLTRPVAAADGELVINRSADTLRGRRGRRDSFPATRREASQIKNLPKFIFFFFFFNIIESFSDASK